MAEHQAVLQVVPGAHLLLGVDRPAFTVVAASDDYLRLAGLTRDRVLGRSVIDLFPYVGASDGTLEIVDSLQRVATHGKPVELLLRRSVVAGAGASVNGPEPSALIQPVLGSDGAVEFLLHTLTGLDKPQDQVSQASHEGEKDRKNSQLRDAFLVRLDDATRPLIDAYEITQCAARLLGEHLHVNRCAYADVDEDEDTFNLTGNYNWDVPSIVGRYTFTQFGAECLRLMREGKPYIVEDSELDPRTEEVRQSYRMTLIRSVICVSLLKSGRFVAAMAVHQATPRRWLPEEVELVQLVASRCWESIERARVARELRVSERRLRLSQRVGRIGSFEWDMKTGRVIWTPELEMLYGVPEGSFEGTLSAWIQRVPPEDAERVIAGVQSCVARKATEYGYEFRAVMPDGAHRWLRGQAQFSYDENGEPERLVGVNIDIDAQKQAEAHLQRQWHTFDTALSHTPDFTYTLDLEGRFTYVNRALLNLWQLPLEEALGKTFHQLRYPPDLADHLQGQIQQVIDTAQPVRDQRPYTGPTGETRHYEYIFVPVLGATGRVESVAGSTRDTTDRNRSEEALRISEERLTFALAAAGGIGTWDWDVAANRLYGNQRFAELFSIDRASVSAGVPVSAFLSGIHPEDRNSVAARFEQAARTGEDYAEEYRVIEKDGSLRWLNARGRCHLDEAGNPVRFSGVVFDFTERKKAEEDLRRMNRELEEFAYVASHDLQEPLRMVNIYSHLILKRLGSDDPAIAQYASFVRQGVTRMEALIHDLLTFSRAVHADELPVGTADLSASLYEAMSVLKDRIDECGAILTADPLPQVRGDTPQMAHVFQNLVSNALKYRRKDVTPHIDITAGLQGEEWIVSVRDNGIGFEPKYSERIFGLFKRLHKEEYPGTGLGLAICKRILERYGGRMWAEGRPGQGATFFFALPAAAAEQGAVSSSQAV